MLILHTYHPDRAKIPRYELAPWPPIDRDWYANILIRVALRSWCGNRENRREPENGITTISHTESLRLLIV